MRKTASIAACALALACAGMTYAANESDTVPKVTSQISGRLQQLLQFVQGNPTVAPKAQTVFDGVSSRSRTTVTNAPALQAEEQTGQAMLLAGLLVMGVIIKRRYGKRD